MNDVFGDGRVLKKKQKDIHGNAEKILPILVICIRFFGVFVLCGRDPFLVVIGSAVLGAHLQRRGKFRGIQPRKNSCYLG